MTVARAIPFHSLCMHHLLPFNGVAHIGYLPAERIVGLSKLGAGGRASVHVAARRAEARREDRDLRAARRGSR